MAQRKPRSQPDSGEPLELDDDIAECWILWRLWLEEKISMSEFNSISIDTLEAGNRALDAWQTAERRALKRAEDRMRGRG